MESLDANFTLWLDTFDTGLASASHYLSGQAGPLGLALFLPPLVVAVAWRGVLHALSVVVLGLATLAALRLNDMSLGLLIYAGTYMVALHAVLTHRARYIGSVASLQLARLDALIPSFLEGLDRRSRDADHVRSTHAALHAKKETEPT